MTQEAAEPQNCSFLKPPSRERSERPNALHVRGMEEDKKRLHMKISTITLEDFKDDKANCGNCTRKGGACPRNKSNKQIHNGNIFGFNGEVVGIIYCCPNYTGAFKNKMPSLFDN